MDAMERIAKLKKSLAEQERTGTPEASQSSAQISAKDRITLAKEKIKEKATSGANLSGEAWTRATPAQTKVPENVNSGFWDRAGDTLRGTVDRQVEGYTRGLEKLTEGLGKAGSWMQDKKEEKQAEQDKQYLDKYQKDLEDALAAGDEKAAKTAQLRIKQVQQRLKTNGDMGDYYDQVNAEAVRKLDAYGDQKGAESQAAFQRAKDGTGVLGGLAVDAGSALADVLGDAAANRLIPGLGTAGRVMRTFGHASEAAEEKGVGLGTQMLYGAGIAGIGEGVNRLFSGNPILEKATGKGALDDLLLPNLGKSLPGRMVKSGLGEGIEEGTEDILDALYQKAVFGEKADPFSWKETGRDALIGGIVGGLTGLSKPRLTDENGNWYDANGKKNSDSDIEQTDMENAAFESKAVPDHLGAVALLQKNLGEVSSMQPVAVVTGQEVPKTGVATERVMTFLKNIGGKVERPGFGDVLFSKSKVKNSLLGHGFGEAKVELMAGVPGVIRDGKQIGFTENWKGRGYDSYVFAAPVQYRGEPVYVTAIVIRDSANRYYLHEAVDQNGNMIFGQNKSPDTASDGPAAVPQDTVAGSELSENSVPQIQGRNNGKIAEPNQQNGTEPAGEPDIMPKATRSDAEIDADLQRIRQKNLAETTVQPGGFDTDGYMEALAQDENELIDPVTPADIIYDAKMRGLQQEEAPPEKPREPVGKRDLDELMQLYQDIANPVDTARSARFEESEGLVSPGTQKERKSIRQQASEAKSYFMRKMVDAGDSVSRIGKAVKDEYLYPFYNMARSSASAGINMIQGEQTDITGKRVGQSLNDIFAPIREKGDKYYEQFQTYLFDLHNIDRMNLVRGDNTAKLEAEMALREFDRENPDVATLTEARLQRKADSIDEEEAALARERIRLLRKVNQADRMGNKPVFGWEVTADMSRERSDQLLRDHPEFAQYRDQVRQYIKNLMQYRVDSGLMTQEDADFLEKHYPNYVPTFRQTEKRPGTRNRKSVQVGKTVGLAEGGNQKLVPLHEALGKQTMQVVREGSKNRFGARLLADFNSNSHDSKIRKYILDAKEYESDFSTETFDQMETELKKANTFTVYMNGNKYEMTVDPSMFDAVKALYPDAQESNVVIKTIRAGNNLFKALVTGYNPTFTVRNTVRDLQTAGLYSRDAVAFAENYPKALREIAKNGDYWKQYKALGGSFSSVFDYQTGTVNEPDGKVARMAAKMEALNMAMEQAPRLAEFMSVVKAGDGSMENLMDAMNAAADVTVNFGRSGTLGKVLNANFVPFLNPGIQGFDKMIRRVTETKGGKEWAKLAIRAAVLGVAPSVLNGLLYSDDEDWDDLKDSDKDTNYLFKIGDGVWLKLPKGRELSILSMAADRIHDVENGEDVDWGDFITTAGNQVAPANPLEQNILKAWFDTDLFDASSPGRTWYGGDIESQRLRNYAPGERYDSSTDVFSKWVGKQLNISPKKINYLLDQYSGVVGDFMLPLLTPQAERGMFTKAFTVDSVSSNKLSGEFYDKSDELTYAKNGGDITAKVVSRFWSKQQAACSDLYAEIRRIELSSMSDAEKRQKVRETRVILNGVQKNALAVLDTYEATVKKYLRGDSEDDLDWAYREANRECFGAEYALEVYGKDTYEKANQAYQNGVGYDDFYTYYFETKGFTAGGGKSINTKKMEYLQKADLSEKAKAELYFADIASDSDLKKQAELENSNGITAEEYWQYKVATSGMKYKDEKLEAINGLDLTVDQKTALYYANNWAESTLDDAPWFDIVPRLSGGYEMPRLSAQDRIDIVMPKLV